MSFFSLLNSTAPSSSRRIFWSCRSNVISFFDTSWLRVLYCFVSGWTSRHILSGIGICSREDCWIELEFGSDFVFALGLSVSFQEFGSILNSCEPGCPPFVVNHSLLRLEFAIFCHELVESVWNSYPGLRIVTWWKLNSNFKSWLPLMVIGIHFQYGTNCRTFTNPAFRFRGWIVRGILQHPSS